MNVPYLPSHTAEERLALLKAAPFVIIISAGVAQAARWYSKTLYGKDLKRAASKVGINLRDKHLHYASAFTAVVTGLLTRRITIGRWV